MNIKGITILLFTFLFFVGIGFRANAYILNNYSDNITSFTSAIQNKEVALVFGGGMIDDHTMSSYQYERVKTAISLYKQGGVQRLIMTGDDGGDNDDEVHAMQKMAIEYGVPPDDIDIDPHGYRTYLSCLRAKEVFKLESIVAVSQDFHLPRIRYFCESFGINTIGMETNHIKNSSKKITHFREFGARVKGWWQVEVTKPKK